MTTASATVRDLILPIAEAKRLAVEDSAALLAHCGRIERAIEACRAAWAEQDNAERQATSLGARRSARRLKRRLQQQRAILTGARSGYLDLLGVEA